MDEIFTKTGILVVAALLFVAPIMAGVSIALNLNGFVRVISCLATITEYFQLCFTAIKYMHQ